MNLEQIVKDCIEGKRLAQNQLFEAFAPKLLGICYRYAGNRDDAEEIMQEAFIKIFSHLRDFRFEGSLEGWMKRIAVNTAINFLHKRQNMMFIVESRMPDRSEDDAEEFDIWAEAEMVMECISLLPSGYRIVINMFAIEGFSHKEVGDKLNISESTSRSQYSRAKEALKKLVAERLKKNETASYGR